MKVVDIIRSSWLTNPVGPSRILERIIENNDYFNQQGYNVDVFTLDRIIERQFKETNHKPSLKQGVIKYIRRLSKYSSFISEIIIEKTLFDYGKKIVSHYETLKRSSDIIVFDDIFSCYSFLKMNPKKNVKTVLLYHNNGSAFDALDFYYPKLRGSSYYKELLSREKFVLSKIDRVVFIASYGMNNFQSIHPQFDKNKCTFFHNGIDDINIDNNSGKNEIKYRLCCAGTINERKGQRIIIDAMLQLPKEKQLDFQVRLFGNGPLLPELKKIVDDNDLSNTIIFEGTVDNKEMPSKLIENNIFILMSYEEGLPISIIEAMRASLPVISTKISGIPEQVETGYNGVIIEPSVDQLVDIFNNMQNYDWKKMGDNSRNKFLEKFTFNQMMESYCKMLDKVK